MALPEFRKERCELSFKWMVYRHEFNAKKIVEYNIFNHGLFKENVDKALKECKTREEFAEALKRELFYYFGYKAEHEVVITSWVPYIGMSELDRLNAEREKRLKEYNQDPHRLYVCPDVREKVDVYSQVMLNFDVFVDYVWSHAAIKN